MLLCHTLNFDTVFPCYLSLILVGLVRFMQQSSHTTTPQLASSQPPESRALSRRQDAATLSTADPKKSPVGRRMFYDIPTSRPITPLLNQIDTPADLKPLSPNDLLVLADEMREFLLYSIGQSGGHFGANLGVVELTIALHYLLDTPNDKLVWDVGHQAYVHKVLTGRREQLATIRAQKGLTAFPERAESQYDTFGVGHSSTSISAGLGMSLALRHLGSSAKVVSVIGDGAMTGGMAFEAMNDAVQQNADLMVVLNDNDMSISCAIGGFSRHLAMLWQSGYQVDITKAGMPKLTHRPAMPLGNRRARHHEQRDVPQIADNLFKAIGFAYFGPFDGHDLPELLRVFERAKQVTGPVLVHVYTTKGKGFLPAEADPVGYHAIGKLPVPVSPKPSSSQQTTSQATNQVISQVISQVKSQVKSQAKKYAQVFGEFICDKAEVDANLMAITPAMEEGSGMTEFARRFPEQFFDVAIAEQHAVTVAAGMATLAVKPIVAIYSTFLQRGYDQLIHDVALQNLDVMFAIDRAGLVGEDGATHAGVFDLAFLRCIPNMVVATPKDENECYQLLNCCYEHIGPTAVRYPRGLGEGAPIMKPAQLVAIGKAAIELVCQTPARAIVAAVPAALNAAPNTLVADKARIKMALLAFGPIVSTACKVARKLVEVEQSEIVQPIDITVVNMRWVKPLDTAIIDDLIAQGYTQLVTLEEHTVLGGAGSAVNEYVLNRSASDNCPPIQIKNIGLPDAFIAHGSHEQQLAECGLDVAGMMSQLQALLATRRLAANVLNIRR